MQSIRRFLSTYKAFFSRRNIVIAILFAIGLTLFLSIYDSVQRQDGIASFDDSILTWALANQNPRLTTGMRLITDIASPIGISIITLAGAAIWAWRTRDYWRPSLVVGAVAFAFVVSAVIKTITARDRPTFTDLIDANAIISYSFPSGHTIGVAVLLLVLAYFFCTNTPTLQRVFSWSLIVFSDIAIVAFSRIYLGYHWLTDVTASVGLAFIILAIVITIDTYAPRRRKPSTSSKAV